MSAHRKFWLTALLVALFLSGVVSFYASGSPDGLERVAGDTGIDAGATDHAMADSPLADYSARGVDNPRLSGGLAGVIGVALTLAMGGVLFFVLARRRGGSGGGDPVHPGRSGGPPVSGPDPPTRS